nr:MAG TPA: hypothetical protein [Caudoviricetes sp.]
MYSLYLHLYISKVYSPCQHYEYIFRVLDVLS